MPARLISNYSRYSDWLRAEQSDYWGSIPGGGLGIFIIDIMSRPALRPTQPPTQWVSGDLSLGVQAAGT
jgi:hypothetical protein